METWVTRQTVYEGPIFSVVMGQARLDNEQVVRRDVVEHHGGVAVVPILGSEVVLIRQFRVAINKELLELPAGRLEGEEEPVYRAQRELEEEIGFRAGRWVLATAYYSSAGFTTERMYIYLAYDLVETAVSPEFDERIQPVRIPIADIPYMLSNHEIEDAKTLIGLRELLAAVGS